jgi:predicted nucleic acid-binding protein
LDEALQDKQFIMVPGVLAELLSDPKLDSDVASGLAALPMAEIGDGFWIRAGRLRAEVLSTRHKARLGDALIAQFCVDHQIHLVTRDRDFRTFANAAKLSVLIR